MITIDGQTFRIGIIKITRKASLNRESHGTTLDGRKHYDALGTYFDYDVTIDTKAINVKEYDRLYEVITQPVEYHIVTMPYGQDEISFKAMIKTSNDSVPKYTSINIALCPYCLKPSHTIEPDIIDISLSVLIPPESTTIFINILLFCASLKKAFPPSVYFFLVKSDQMLVFFFEKMY